MTEPQNPVIPHLATGPTGKPAFDKKWLLWGVFGVIGIIILFVLFGGGLGSGSSTDTTGGGGGGGGGSNATLDAELQKLQSEIDQLLANQNKKPPPKKKKHHKGDGDISHNANDFHHVLDKHGFANHQQLGQ